MRAHLPIGARGGASRVTRAPRAKARMATGGRTQRRFFTRARARGAALVEAALVIPVMLVFLGLIMFTARSYNEKIDQQTTLRSQALTYASHSCAKGAAGVNTEKSSADVDDSDIGNAASKLNITGLTGTRSYVIGRRSTTVHGTAANDGRLVGFSRPIRSMSKVACSPKPDESRWESLLFMATSLARGGGSGLF